MTSASPATTTQITKEKLPAWVNKAAKENYKYAKSVVNRPFQQWGGPDVADESNMTTDAYKLMMENVGKEDPLYENAAALQSRIPELDPTYSKAYGMLDQANIQAGKVNTLDPVYAKSRGLVDDATKMTGRISELDPIYKRAQELYGSSTGPWNPQPYLNPYTDEVERRSISNAERSLDQNMMQVGDKARKAGAFGGSASAVEKGVLAAEGARGIGDLSAELRRAGYDKATADMLADREQRQKAAGGMVAGAQAQGQGYMDAAGRLIDASGNLITGANAQAQGFTDAAGRMIDASGNLISGAGQQGKGWLDAASGYIDTAKNRQASVLSDVGAMQGAGKEEMAHRQAQIEAAKAKFYEKRDRPLDELNIRLAALGMSPYGKTETTKKTATSEQQGPDFATIGLGLLQMLPMLSDKTAKKNVKRVDKGVEGEFPVYSFNYKGDAPGTPKEFGPMAQDIEKKIPEAITELGGKKYVNAGVLGAVKGDYVNKKLEDHGFGESTSKDEFLYNRSNEINPSELKKNRRYEIEPGILDKRRKAIKQRYL